MRPKLKLGDYVRTKKTNQKGKVIRSTEYTVIFKDDHTGENIKCYKKSIRKIRRFPYIF